MSYYEEARNVKMGESRSLNGVDARVRNVSTFGSYGNAAVVCLRKGTWVLRLRDLT